MSTDDLITVTMDLKIHAEYTVKFFARKNAWNPFARYSTTGTATYVYQSEGTSFQFWASDKQRIEKEIALSPSGHTLVGEMIEIAEGLFESEFDTKHEDLLHGDFMLDEGRFIDHDMHDGAMYPAELLESRGNGNAYMEHYLKELGVSIDESFEHWDDPDVAATNTIADVILVPNNPIPEHYSITSICRLGDWAAGEFYEERPSITDWEVENLHIDWPE
jgi:hypothetical protein